MLEVLVRLDFDCCRCGKPVGAVIKCEGDGSALESDAKALANLKCPHCRRENYVIFSPRDGQTIDVMSEVTTCRLAEFSRN